jgi:hypothetical protein
MKMEQTECSETSAYNIQTPGNYPEESIKHTEHSESLKSRNPVPIELGGPQNRSGRFGENTDVSLASCLNEILYIIRRLILSYFAFCRPSFKPWPANWQIRQIVLDIPRFSQGYYRHGISNQVTADFFFHLLQNTFWETSIVIKYRTAHK